MILTRLLGSRFRNEPSLDRCKWGRDVGWETSLSGHPALGNLQMNIHGLDVFAHMISQNIAKVDLRKIADDKRHVDDTTIKFHKCLESRVKPWIGNYPDSIEILMIFYTLKSGTMVDILQTAFLNTSSSSFKLLIGYMNNVYDTR